MRMTSLPLFLLAAMAGGFVPVAHAGDLERAEHMRIYEEMKRMAQRNQWPAVEANYQKLLDLEKRGEKIEAREHVFGAQAARSLGDVTAARARFVRAREAGASEEQVAPIAEIDASFAPVSIRIDRKYKGGAILAPTEPPFLPDQRACVDAAVARVAARASYDGLLPAGDYTLDGVTFTVVAGAATPVAVSLAPPPVAKVSVEGLKWAGPRASLGVAFMNGGAPGEGGEAALQAGAFGGGGARASAGYAMGSGRFGVVGMVGYHSLFGTPSVDGKELEPTALFDVKGNSMHMGYAWIAGEARLGRLWVAGGPIYGVGKAAVTGVAGACAEGGGCADYPALAGDVGSYQRLSGTVFAGGGAGSVSYALIDLGKLSGAVTVEGGAQTDTFRWYPWGQLAFTLAPATHKED
ncbi:MAG: hypothetical protein RLZZ299_3131 [Pseudomonadota bacterium]|jgi:hypothetical protein